MVMLGTDPEFAVKDTVSGRIIPAHRVFPDKHKKMVFEKGKIFRDGFMAEVNLNTPILCRQEFMTNVYRTIQQGQIRAAAAGQSIELVPKSAVKIDVPEFLDGAPPDVMEFGCDPSRDAYKGGEPSQPKGLDVMHSWRYGAGHLHFSDFVAVSKEFQKIPAYNSPLTDTKNHPEIAQLLDYFIGLPLTIAIPGEEQFIRRQYYGLAGEYRSQEYSDHTTYKCTGMEYRTPPAEIWLHPVLIHLALGVAKYALLNYNSLPEALTWFRRNVSADLRQAVQRAINTGHRAVELCPTLSGYYTPDTLLTIRKALEGRSPQVTHGAYENYIDYIKVIGGEVPRREVYMSYNFLPKVA